MESPVDRMVAYMSLPEQIPYCKLTKDILLPWTWAAIQDQLTLSQASQHPSTEQHTPKGTVTTPRTNAAYRFYLGTSDRSAWSYSRLASRFFFYYNITIRKQ